MSDRDTIDVTLRVHLTPEQLEDVRRSKLPQYDDHGIETYVETQRDVRMRLTHFAATCRACRAVLGATMDGDRVVDLPFLPDTVVEDVTQIGLERLVSALLGDLTQRHAIGSPGCVRGQPPAEIVGDDYE